MKLVDNSRVQGSSCGGLLPVKGGERGGGTAVAGRGTLAVRVEGGLLPVKCVLVWCRVGAVKKINLICLRVRGCCYVLSCHRVVLLDVIS